MPNPHATVTIITATARLARELTRRHDLTQQQAGHRTWQSADILPYPAWLTRTWTRIAALRPCPLLLDESQLTAAWEAIIAHDIRGEQSPLWNTAATAKIAVDAWRTLNAWQINLADCAASPHEDHHRMSRWAQAFQTMCAKREWTDPHRLATQIAELLTAADGQKLATQTDLTAIQFTGFTPLSPQQQTLITALTTAGVKTDPPPTVATSTTPPPPSKIHHHASRTDTDQWLHAAHWAREKLLANPGARLAIISPDLRRAASAIDHALRQILAPQQLIHPAAAAEQPWHLSLGAALAHHPPAHAALALLAPFAGQPLSADQVAAILRTPFIQAADHESIPRAKLEQWCRRHLPYQIRLPRLVRILTRSTGGDDATDDEKADSAANATAADDGAKAGLEVAASTKKSASAPPSRPPSCPRLVKALSAALPLLGAGERAAAGQWARRFDAWLSALGWPGERALSSDEFQAAAAVRRELQHLARLDLTAAPMTAAAALAWLRRRLREQPFQVAAHQAPVQVLGVLETTGLRFDALWFGGLSIDDWPPAARPNPFLPLALQRTAGVTEADAERHAEHIAATQRRIEAAADEVVLAWPLSCAGVATEPSTFIDAAAAEAASIEAAEAATTATNSPAVIPAGSRNPARQEAPTPQPNLHATVTTAANQAAAATPLAATPTATTPPTTAAQYIHAAAPVLQCIEDTQAPPLTDAVRGGAALLENQANCPFRAFAVHRLGARAAQGNEQGLGAAERGSLIHHALQLLWREIGTSRRLHELSPDELQAMLRAAADAAGLRHLATAGCGEQFQAVQTEWACALLGEWLAAEKHRAGFAVVACESKTELRLGALELRFQIDRIDRLENGEVALIDYKTGSPAGLDGWVGERPQSPQLPLYALAQDKPVGAVAYGWVRRGKCGFGGVQRGGAGGEFDGDGGAGQSPNRVSVPAAVRAMGGEFAGLDDLFAHWRVVLGRLADEFTAGEAAVAPATPQVCERCDLHGLCRIDSAHEELA